jgi:hypothetical protein
MEDRFQLDGSQPSLRERGMPPHLATGQIVSTPPYMAD